MIVLGLDIGTNFGWAVLINGKLHSCGTWTLLGPQKKDLPKYLRYTRANVAVREKILELQAEFPGKKIEVGYELVMGHGRSGVLAAHTYGGLLACGVWLTMCQMGHQNLEVHDVHVSSWKKTFTGSGKATKPEYIAKANERYGLTLRTKGVKDEDKAAALGVANHVWEKLNV